MMLILLCMHCTRDQADRFQVQELFHTKLRTLVLHLTYHAGSDSCIFDISYRFVIGEKIR